MPLPESDGEWSETESTDSDDLFSDIGNYDGRGLYGMSPLSKCHAKNNSVSHSQAIADRLNLLDLKAHEYTIASTLNNNNNGKRANREFTLVYLEKNRFNAQEAAALEEEYQRKVRHIFKLRLEEEAKRAREELERQTRAAAEAARRAAKEKARQEELQQRQREQEELEQRRKHEELARAQAEKEREEEEKKQEAVQKEAELKKQQEEKAARDKAAQVAAEQAKQQQQQQPQQYTGPQVYGRKSVSAETAAVNKVLAALKKVRQDVSNEPQFIKSKNLMAIRRELRPKLGQLNGEKAQTVAVVSF